LFLPQFYNLFYVNRIKVVPSIIFELLTPIGLAFWICDDGGRTNSGLVLHTNSYTLEEVILLVNVLKLKFNLDCRYQQKLPGQWIIIIPNRDLPKLHSLVSEYIHPSMLYKIRL